MLSVPMLPVYGHGMQFECQDGWQGRYEGVRCYANNSVIRLPPTIVGRSARPLCMYVVRM